MMKTSLVRILGLSLALSSLGLWAVLGEETSFRVIVRPDNPVTSLSKAQVSRILFKKVSMWEHGEPIKAVDQGASEEVREAFTKAIHGRSLGSVQRYWQRQIFSGDGVPPPELAGDREVAEYVRKNPGAIGYVSAGAALDGVKVLTITD